VVLERRGAFAGVDAAMMIHPADDDLLLMTSLAIQQLHVTYEGRAAHAAAAPWQGRNALDAAVLGYVNVAALRQHITPEERVHGVLTEAGEKPNIVPRRAAAEWYVRSASAAGLEALKARVLRCLAAGADAAGCTMAHAWDDHPYLEVRDNEALMQAFAANAATLGRTLSDPRAPGAHKVVGSTDMGNVSYLVPSIHPMLRVAPAGVAIHTPDFAEHACSPLADRAVVDGAKAMAMTAVDLWTTDLLDRARATFPQHA
jgi:metal-dependent amidase/aminoacylase/carboxypeptidase family protein